MQEVALQTPHDATQSVDTLQDPVDFSAPESLSSSSVQKEARFKINVLDEQIATVEKEQILLTAMVAERSPHLGLRDRVKRYLQGGNSDRVRRQPWGRYVLLPATCCLAVLQICLLQALGSSTRTVPPEFITRCGAHSLYQYTPGTRYIL